MNRFISKREQRNWLYALIIWLVILMPLTFDRPFQALLVNENTQALLFSIGMVMTAIVVLIRGLLVGLEKVEWLVRFGILVIFFMLYLRLGVSERSHLIEYGILSVFIHRALLEGVKNTDSKRFFLALQAILITSLFGIIDEVIQYIIPNRTFDIHDIIFNIMASVGAVIGSELIRLIVLRFRKSK